MGIFSNKLGWIPISDKPFFGIPDNLGKIIQGIQGKYLGSNLTPAEQEANAWTAQREDTRYQREVADMQAAGLNPMLAVSGSPGSAQASVSPSQSGNLGELLSFIVGQQQLRLQKRVADADIAVKDAQKGNIEADTALKYQSESESRERERGARIVNDIKEATKEYSIEAAKLDNHLSRAKEKLIYKQMDEIAVNMSKAQAETDTEYSKQALMAAEKCLKEASAWQIYRLTPALNAYYDAQSEAAKGAAAASFAKAAYDNGLINAGYVDAVVKKAAADAGIAADEKILKDIATAVRTGDWGDIGIAPENANLMENVLSGVSILIDNLNPLVGILK